MSEHTKGRADTVATGRKQPLTEREALRAELAAARALLREVSGDKPDFVPRVISQELADRIRSHLDACDTLKGAPNAG